jgi:two-component system probable response regulator PhcQ
MIADRIVSLGLLAAGLSHHIRNALVAVKTFLDLAPAKLKEENLDLASLRNPDFWRDYYESVQAQLDKINHMLRDLWTAAETPSFTFKDRVILRAIVEEVVRSLQSGLAAKQIVVENHIPDTLPSLQVDGPKFGRLFELLLKDELVSLPAGCRVTFTAEVAPEADAEHPGVLVQMRDNGPGLPEEALRLVFDPFLVRSDSPMEYGINLMGCYFIVHHHGGRIEARSQPGQGTTFLLRLPTNANQPPQTQETEEFLQKMVLNNHLWEKLISSD